MSDNDDYEGPSVYSVLVGERLRTIRKQKRLSLHEVESQSDQEFKASVLGAYERGERALSLPRLDRLAQFYRVPVEQLLPRGDSPLAHMWTLIHFGDYMAYYLAMAYGVDPTPIQALVDFKAAMKEEA